jgi:hypothetical protein
MTSLEEETPIGSIQKIFLGSILIIIVIASTLYPVSLPLPVSKYTKQYLDFIESIPSDTIVGFMVGDMPQTKRQLKSSTVITMAKLWEKHSKIIFWYDTPVSGPILSEYIEEAENLIGELVYGVDYVILGFMSGGEIGLTVFLSDMRKATNGVDVFGNSFEELPLMKGVENGFDLKYGFANTACQVTEQMYIRQWQQPYKAEIATINCASDRTLLMPFLSTGQLKATASGLLASAELEQLTGYHGSSYKILVTVSFLGLYFIILVILGNFFPVLMRVYTRFRTHTY